MRGKITAIALAILMSTVSLSVIIPGISGEISGIGESPFAGGTGTIGDPYIIQNVTELQAMNMDLMAHYALGNDIDATATLTWGWNATTTSFEGFVPIAYDTDNSTQTTHQGPWFSGSLDGRGYSINGLFINRPDVGFQSLFGNSGGSVVNCNINGNITGYSRVGGIVGYLGGGTLKHSSYNGIITSTADRSGGLVGWMLNGVVDNCTVTGSVTGTTIIGGAVGVSVGGDIFNTYSIASVNGTNYIGGLVGETNGDVVNCTTFADVTGNANTGGLVGGLTSNGMVENCTTSGYTTGTANVGGLVAEADLGSSVSNSSAYGNVNGTSNVGGLIGMCDADIYGCSAHGMASGTSINVGGLIGYSTGTVNMSHSTGDAYGTDDYVGAFAGRSDGDIIDCYSIGNSSGRIHVGGFIGANLGTISHSTSIGMANASMEYAGGFTGSSSGTIDNCSSTGAVSGSSDYAGGFAGWSNGDITDCHSTGSVSGTGIDVGGLIGYNDGGTVSNCYSTGSVNGTGNNVGGLIGDNTGAVSMSYSTGNVGSSGGTGHGGLVGSTTGTISFSYATGNVYGVTDVGGLCGFSDIEISQSFATGNVNATGDNAGGLIGNKWGSSVTDCYAQGDVIGLQNVGGLIGQNYNGVFTSYSTGNASGTMPEVGGFIGYRGNGGISDCYFDNQTSGTDIEIGVIGGGPAPDITPYNTTEMMMQATFTNWDFTSIWGIHENYTYPFLQAFAALTPPPSADLGINITDSADPVMVGDTLFYNVTVTNYGPVDATMVNATIHLPADVLYVSSNQTMIFWGQSNLSWEIGNMTVGQVEYWSINVTVISAVEDVLNCTVDVNASSTDNGLYPNEDFELTANNEAPNAVNDAPAAILEDSGANTIDVLANDNDPDAGDAITIIGITQGTNGVVAITNGGADLSYTPNADYFGVDSFTYTIEDMEGLTDTATVSMTITSVNDVPMAFDDTAIAIENGGIIYIDVLANDTDIDGDSLNIDGVTQGTNGAVILETGNVSYTPDTDFSGTDSFTYTIIDGNGGSDTATVNVTVQPEAVAPNQAPVAVNDTATVDEDSTATTIDVLDNDSDLDGDTLTISAVTQPINGAVAIIDSGLNVTYVPDADFNGVDTFTYTIGDGSGLLVNATVTVTVTNVNDAPVIETFTVPDGAVGEEWSIVISVIDIDENDTISWTLNTNNTWLGMVPNITDPACTLIGTPTANGTFLIQFSAEDDLGASDTIFFNITVGSGIPDTDDNTTTETDTDGDGVPDSEDDFPNDPDEDTDTDGDGVGDNADDFPDDPDEDTDTDGDGVGDNTDTDDDGDGVPDVDDDTPTGDDPADDDDDDADSEDNFLADYWWIILVVVIVLVMILIFGRKKKDDEEPEEPTEEEDSEESDEDEEVDDEPEDEEDLEEEEEEDSEESSTEETDIDEEK